MTDRVHPAHDPSSYTASKAPEKELSEDVITPPHSESSAAPAKVEMNAIKEIPDRFETAHSIMARLQKKNACDPNEADSLKAIERISEISDNRYGFR